MSTPKSTKAPEADLLARLASALDGGTEAGGVRAILAELGIAAGDGERFAVQASHVLERAQVRLPQASTTELELALGVLLVLCNANPPSTPQAAS